MNKMISIIKFTSCLAVALAVAGTAFAQDKTEVMTTPFGATVPPDAEIDTTPFGGVKISIAAGAGTMSKMSVVSFPLYNHPEGVGAVVGKITAVTSTTISDENAEWAVPSFVTAESPMFLRIKSGAAEGRTFQITSNTADTLTISSSDGVSTTAIDFVSLGVVADDTYEIIVGDTILSAFGRGTIDGDDAPLGGSNINNADVIRYYNNGQWQLYFYSLASNTWENLSRISVNNMVISPDSCILYERRMGTLSFVLTGFVPTVQRQVVVRNGGATMLSAFLPVDITLNELGLEKMPGWVKSTVFNSADKVSLFLNGNWMICYHNGTRWTNLSRQAVGDSIIDAGTAMNIERADSLQTTGTVFKQSLPYEL